MFTGGGETAPRGGGEDPTGETGVEREAPGHDPPGDDPHRQDGVPAGRQRHYKGAARRHERYGNCRGSINKGTEIVGEDKQQRYRNCTESINKGTEIVGGG